MILQLKNGLALMQQIDQLGNLNLQPVLDWSDTNRNNIAQAHNNKRVLSYICYPIVIIS